MIEPLFSGKACKIYHACAREVAALVEPGSCSLAIVDGPYGMSIADWDKIRLDDLPAWYAPHFDDLGLVCAGSATVYLWNTIEGWARLDPEMRARGWKFQTLIIWNKISTPHSKTSIDDIRYWPTIVEACGMYTREAWAVGTSPGALIGYAAGRDDRNWVRVWLAAEWDRSGLRRGEADRALGTNGMAGHYFASSQWALPTWEAYQKLAEHAEQNGASNGGRGYFVLEQFADASYDHLRASYDHLRASYDHLRAEYEASRPVFSWDGKTNQIWTAPAVNGPERLAAAAHPSQKPLAWAARMIEASSRPGDQIWVPFGGTCREAFVCEDLAARSPELARRVITADTDEGYLQAVVAELEKPRPASIFDAVARNSSQVAFGFASDQQAPPVAPREHFGDTRDP